MRWGATGHVDLREDTVYMDDKPVGRIEQRGQEWRAETADETAIFDTFDRAVLWTLRPPIVETGSVQCRAVDCQALTKPYIYGALCDEHRPSTPARAVRQPEVREYHDPTPPPRQPATVVRPEHYGQLPMAVQQMIRQAQRGKWRFAVTTSCGPLVGASGEVLEKNVWSLVFRAERNSQVVKSWIRRGQKWSTNGTWINRARVPSAAAMKWMTDERS